MDQGKRAITIDKVLLEWCLQPGIKLDFCHFSDGYVVTAAAVDAELARIVTHSHRWKLCSSDVGL
jgi:hypothetical protein